MKATATLEARGATHLEREDETLPGGPPRRTRGSTFDVESSWCSAAPLAARSRRGKKGTSRQRRTNVSSSR